MKNKHKISKNLHHQSSQNKTVRVLVFILILVAVTILILTFIPKFKNSEKETATPKEACESFCETNQRTLFCFAKIYQNDIAVGTCEELAASSRYNVEKCETISCEIQPVDKTCVNGLNGNWEIPEADGSCPQITGKIIRKVLSSDSAPIAGQICCREVLG